MIQKQAKNRLNEEKNQNVLMKNFPIYLETEKKNGYDEISLLEKSASPKAVLFNIPHYNNSK